MKLFRIGSLVVTCFLLLLLVVMPKEAEALDLAAHYLQEEQYIDAIEALEGQGVDPLIMGNTYYKAAQSLEQDQGSDSEEIADLYNKALTSYEKGMIEAPQRIDLKYNYEYVENLKPAQEDQDNQDESDSGDQSDQNESESGEQGDQNESESGEQGDQNESESGEQGDQNESESGEQGDQNESESGEQGDQNESESGEQGDQDESNSSDQDEQDKSNSDASMSQEASDTDDETDPNSTASSDAVSEEQSVLDESAVTQILKMLEEKERDSLKNNQQVIKGQGDGGKHDW